MRSICISGNVCSVPGHQSPTLTGDLRLKHLYTSPVLYSNVASLPVFSAEGDITRLLSLHWHLLQDLTTGGKNCHCSFAMARDVEISLRIAFHSIETKPFELVKEPL